MEHGLLFSGCAAFCVLFVFAIHWIYMLPVKDSALRLKKSRILYLSLSAVLVVSSFVLAAAAGTGPHTSFLIPAGCVFALVGDWCNLQFPLAQRITRNEPVFGGIVSFCITQICFLLAFRERVSALIDSRQGVFLVLLLFFLTLPLIVFITRVFTKGMSRRILLGSLLYGTLLGAMAATAVCAALFIRGPWLLIASGAVLYLVSDARLGMTTLHGYHPPNEFQIPWITYLAAQALIINGFGLLSL